MLAFLKEQFLSQNLEDVDFISLSKSQGEKSLNFSEEIPVKELKKERKSTKKNTVYYYTRIDKTLGTESFIVQIRGASLLLQTQFYFSWK